MNHIHKFSSNPVPASREEAVILCYALNELLPQGVIRRRYKKTNGFSNEESQATPFHLDGDGVKKDFELIDMIMEELGLQVVDELQ